MKCKNFVLALILILSCLLFTAQAKANFLIPDKTLTAHAGISLMEYNEDESADEEEEDDEIVGYNEDESINEEEDDDEEGYIEAEEEQPTESIIKKYSAPQSNMLVAHYKFDGDLKDASANKNDGYIAHGDITFENGKKGKAAKFDGESYIEVEDNEALNLEEAFTISVWLYKLEDKNYGYAPILAKGTGTASEDPPYVLFHDGAIPNPYLMLHNKEEWDSLTLNNNYTTKFKQWHLLTVTFDANKERVNFYLNGAFKGYESWEYGAVYSTEQNLYIGFGEIYSLQGFYTGLMDELKIYNYALGDKEIKALYNDVVPEVKEYQALSITPNKMAMIKEEGILNINVIGVMKDGRKDDITKMATYQSSDTKIASVTNEGKITTLSKGTVTITVTYGKLIKKINITVK